MDYESQLKVTKQQKMQNGTIASWESLETFWQQIRRTSCQQWNIIDSRKYPVYVS